MEMRENEQRIHLANIILMNPDYEIETFKNDYSDLRAVIFPFFNSAFHITYEILL